LKKGVNGYRLWDPVSKKKIFSRDMVFDQAYMLGKCEDEASTDSNKGKKVLEVEFDDQNSPINKCDDEQFSRDSQN
jgi:hypothetical protein